MCSFEENKIWQNNFRKNNRESDNANYEDVLEGPKPNEIIKSMRLNHNCDLSYSQTYKSLEFVISAVTEC